MGAGGPDPALGVFDTLLVRGGRPVDVAAHAERLARSVRELYGVPAEAAWVARRITEAATGLDGGRVRTAYRPSGGTWDVSAEPLVEPGPTPRTLAVRRVEGGGLGAHKWLDRGPVTPPAGADDVLLVTDAGDVLECGSANVFAVVSGMVVTPPLDGRILPGTVRARVLATLGPGAVAERPLALAELADASEVFTTSSIRGVQPVARCREGGETCRWEPGSTALRLRRQLGPD